MMVHVSQYYGIYILDRHSSVLGVGAALPEGRATIPITEAGEIDRAVWVGAHGHLFIGLHNIENAFVVAGDSVTITFR